MEQRPKLKVKRRQLRRRRHQSAWITLPDQKARQECAVQDVSVDGAKITLDAKLDVESQIGLAFVPHGPARRCAVVWRRGNMLGIKFVD
jgi:hypothetical protein